MEPIQLQCGSCGQTMAISPEHMGSQVQCPHCQAVVQTPAPAGAGFAAPPAPGQGEQQESIFSQPEPTDDLFGDGAGPKVEMPHLEMPPQPMMVASGAQTVTIEEGFRHAPPQEPAAPAPFPQAASAAVEEDLTTFTPRRVSDRSLFGPILLVFLVPYAICTTGYIAYLLYMWPKPNPLQFLPDPAVKGQPRQQVQHDLPLDRNMKTAMGKPIRVADIEITPLQVKVTPEKDLMLIFRAKNLSKKVFSPMSDDYLKFSAKSLVGARPYTFLERGGKDNLKKRLYGGYLEQFKGPLGQEPFDGDIGPDQEAVIHLSSDLIYRNQDVRNILNAAEPLVWRVQVRCGEIPVDGKMISATTVIGVEFTARDIVKGDG